jgi:hypothetical protein
VTRFGALAHADGTVKNSELTWHDEAARPPVVWMVAGRRTPRTIYSVREQGGSAMTHETTENAGVALWRHLPSWLD